MVVRFSHVKNKDVYLFIQSKQKKIRKKICDCEPEHWDANNRMINDRHPDFDILYPEMMDINLRAKMLLRKNINDPSVLMDMIFQKNTENDFVVFCHEYLEDLKKLANKAEMREDLTERNRLLGNVKHYNDPLKKLKKYKPQWYYQDMTTATVQKLFFDFKMDGNISESTAARYLKRLKSLYHYMCQAYALPDQRPFNISYNVTTTRSYDMIKKRLDFNQLKKLYDYQSLPESQRRAVMLFLCCFEMGGCDLVDLYYLKKSDYLCGRVYMMRSKVRGSSMNLMATDTFKKLIANYPGDDVYLLPWGKSAANYKTFIRNTTRDLQRACDKMGVTTVAGNKPTLKSARHTFAHRAKELNVPSELRRQLMGHKLNNVANYYEDDYSNKVSDAAQLKVISL